MNRTSIRLASFPALVTAIVIGVIGLVWAGTSAQEDTTPDAFAPVESTVPSDPDDGEDLESLVRRVEELEAAVADLGGKVDEAIARIDAAVAQVATYAAKVSRLDENGIYSGTVRPNQIAPKLQVADVQGQWPLDRTRGDLTSDRLAISVNGCSPDSRFWSVLTLSSFRQFTCVRIPK